MSDTTPDTTALRALADHMETIPFVSFGGHVHPHTAQIETATLRALCDGYDEAARLRGEVASYTATTCACGHDRTSHTPLDFGDCSECPHGTCGKYPGIKWDLWHRDTLRDATAERERLANLVADLRAIDPLFPVPQRFQTMSETRAYRDGASAQRDAFRALIDRHAPEEDR